MQILHCEEIEIWIIHLKTEESTNNKNNKTTRFNVALEEKIICSICKKPGQQLKNVFI